MSDVLLIEGDYNILADRIKKLSPKFFKFWNDNVEITNKDMLDFGIDKKQLSRICSEFNVRPSTGGLLFSMAAKTSMFQNITMYEYINDTTEQLAIKLSKKSNENKLDEIKLNIYKDFENILLKEDV